MQKCPRQQVERKLTWLGSEKTVNVWKFLSFQALSLTAPGVYKPIPSEARHDVTTPHARIWCVGQSASENSSSALLQAKRTRTTFNAQVLVSVSLSPNKKKINNNNSSLVTKTGSWKWYSPSRL